MRLDDLLEDGGGHPDLDTVERIFSQRFPGFTDEVWATVDALERQTVRAHTRHAARAVIEVVGEANLDLSGLPDYVREDIGRYRSELSDRELLEHCVRVWLSEATACWDYLLDLPVGELAEITAEPTGDQHSDDLLPQEFTAFYAPFPQASFRFWARFEFWTPEEAAALSFDADPHALLSETEEDAEEEEEDEASAFEIAHDRRTSIIRRAQEIGRLPSRITPSHFAAWAQRSELLLGTKFEEWATNAVRAADDEDLPKGQRLSTLYRMLVGMAIRHCGFDPQRLEGSESYRLIGLELEEVWDTMSPKTVKDQLHEAVRHLDERGYKPTIPSSVRRRLNI